MSPHRLCGLLLACGALFLLGQGRSPAAAPPGRARVDLHGDPLPPGALARLGTARLRNAWGGIYAFAFSPDGRFLVSAGAAGSRRLENGGGRVTVWDRKTGRRVRTLSLEGTFYSPVLAGIGIGPSYSGDCLFAFTPDSKALITLSTVKGPLQVWGLASGRELKRLPAPTSDPTALATFPDGKALACSGSDGDLYVLGLFDDRPVRRLPELGEQGLIFTPNGLHLVSASWGRVLLYETATGTIVLNIAIDEGPSAVSPDGQTAVSVNEEKGAWLWDLRTGKKRRLALVGKKRLEEMQFSPDGRSLLKFSPDGRSLLLVNREAETVCFWDVGTGKKARTIKAPGLSRVAEPVQLSPDGRTLAAVENWQALRLWDARTGRPLLFPTEPVWPAEQLAFSRDGRALVSHTDGDGTYRWGARTGRLLSHVRLKAEDEDKPARQSQYLSADGALAALVSEDSVQLHDTATGKPVRGAPRLRFRARQALFSPTGTTLAIVAEDGTLRQWDVATGKERVLIDLRRLAQGPSWLLFTPDGRRLTAGDHEERIHLWDTATGKHLKTIPTAPEKEGRELFDGTHRGASFAPNGRSLFLARNYAGLQGWDTVRGVPLPPFEDVRGDPWSVTTGVVVSPDGRWLVRDDIPSGLSLYEVASGKPIHRFPEVCSVVAFAPDGRTVATGCLDDASVFVWGLAELFQIGAGKTTWRDAWDVLADTDASPAYRAVGLLLTDEGRALALLEERLRPVSVFPRSRLAPLVRDLGSAEFARREAATQALAEAGEGARAGLETARRAATDVEARLRLNKLLARLRPRSPERLREHRAVYVLERLGTPRAQALLGKLAGGPDDALLTQEARAALARLGKGAFAR